MNIKIERNLKEIVNAAAAGHQLVECSWRVDL